MVQNQLGGGKEILCFFFISSWYWLVKCVVWYSLPTFTSSNWFGLIVCLLVIGLTRAAEVASHRALGNSSVAATVDVWQRVLCGQVLFQEFVQRCIPWKAHVTKRNNFISHFSWMFVHLSASGNHPFLHTDIEKVKSAMNRTARRCLY